MTSMMNTPGFMVICLNLAAGAHRAVAQRGKEQVGRARTELHWDCSCG